MDDFGSGYSTLNALKDIPINVIKLDRGFLNQADAYTRLRGEKIMLHSIGLAKELNITTVAEGVETMEQLGFLRKCECDIGQGFYLSVPLAEDAFINALNKASVILPMG